jgi:hypothetical protein
MTRRFDEERMNEELEHHIALQCEENLRAGMPLADARRAAALSLNLGSAATP